MILRFVLYLVLGYLLIRIVKGLFSGGSAAKGQAGSPGTGDPFRRPERGPFADKNQPEKEEMVFDEVCSTYVPLSTALKAEGAEGDFYFCGEECKSKFLEERNKPH